MKYVPKNKTVKQNDFQQAKNESAKLERAKAQAAKMVDQMSKSDKKGSKKQAKEAAPIS